MKNIKLLLIGEAVSRAALELLLSSKQEHPVLFFTDLKTAKQNDMVNPDVYRTQPISTYLPTWMNSPTFKEEEDPYDYVKINGKKKKKNIDVLRRHQLKLKSKVTTSGDELKSYCFKMRSFLSNKLKLLKAKVIISRIIPSFDLEQQNLFCLAL